MDQTILKTFRSKTRKVIMEKFKGIEITKHTPWDLQGIKWVIKAIGKETTFLALKLLLFQNGCWVATDGHRLHVYATKIEYEESLYEVIVNNRKKVVLKITDTPIENYPEWRDIPFKPLSKEIELSTLSFSVDYTRTIREMDPKVTLQIPYIKDAIDTSEIWTAYMFNGSEQKDSVIFINDASDKLALIMPLVAQL